MMGFAAPSIARYCVHAAILLLCGHIVGVTHAASFSSYVTEENKAVVKLDGEIVSGDVRRFQDELARAGRDGRLVSGLRLSSIGGSVVEAADLADIVRLARMATVVPNGATCASACFIIFAAGAEKFVSRRAWVGVHGASDGDGRETADATAATVGMARIVKHLGVPDGIIGKMVTTPPSDMVWLTETDLMSMGTHMTGKAPDQNSARPSLQAPTQTPTSLQANHSVSELHLGGYGWRRSGNVKIAAWRPGRH